MVICTVNFNKILSITLFEEYLFYLATKKAAILSETATFESASRGTILDPVC